MRHSWKTAPCCSEASSVPEDPQSNRNGFVAAFTPQPAHIDERLLSDEAWLYEWEGVVFVDDDTHPVYFDAMEDAPSIAQGITALGAEPKLGASWTDLDMMLQDNSSVIAYGHITETWRDRFPGEYGDVDEGPIAHFIALFPSTLEDSVIVCDPMHRGGAVVMAQADLQSFFQSPINAFDTTIRLMAWPKAAVVEEEPVDGEVVPEEEPADPYAMALDVHAHHVTFETEFTEDSYTRPSVGGGFTLSGTEFWQKWAGGENPTYQFTEGSDHGRRCMVASAKRFGAILGEHPESMVNLRNNSSWSGSFFNWNDDYSQSDWGDGQSARLWAWRTTLIKWISQTNKDGSCYLPTLEMVERLSENCLQKAATSDGAIVGCNGS